MTHIQPIDENNVYLVVETNKGKMALAVPKMYNSDDPAIDEIIKHNTEGVKVKKYYFAQDGINRKGFYHVDE